MIFPFLDGFLPFRKAPVTWIILLANVFLFSQNWQLSNYCKEQLNHWYQDSDFLYTQGQVYLQYKKGDDRNLASINDKRFVGKLAFKDEKFLKKASKTQWVGDSVAIRLWQDNLKEYMVLRDFYPAFLFGVSETYQAPLSFFSYQFFHEGAIHLIGNLVLILLVGGFLERRHSGSLVLGIYLFSGAFSAWLYTIVLGANGAPLIGASGSLCGLLGFLFVAYFHEKTKLFYFVLPAKGYYGFFHLKSCYWVIWLCMLEDVAGWLARPDLYSGGISYFVHMAGFVGGALLALGYAFAEERVVPSS